MQIINDHVAAAQSASSSVHYAEESHSKGETDIRTVLNCYDAQQRVRQEFFDAVLDYNMDIAEYVAAVAAPGTASEKFVAMLIPAKSAAATSAVPIGPPLMPPTIFGQPGVRGSASAPTPARANSQSPVRTSQPANENWVPSATRPDEADRRSEPSYNQAPASASAPRQPDPFAPATVGDRYGNGNR